MFKDAEGTKIYSVRRKAIPDVYNSLTKKCRPYSGVDTSFKQFIMMTSFELTISHLFKQKIMPTLQDSDVTVT